MQTEGIYANNKILSSLVNHKSKRIILSINSIILVIAWIALSRFFRLIETITPRLPKRCDTWNEEARN